MDILKGALFQCRCFLIFVWCMRPCLFNQVDNNNTKYTAEFGIVIFYVVCTCHKKCIASRPIDCLANVHYQKKYILYI